MLQVNALAIHDGVAGASQQFDKDLKQRQAVCAALEIPLDEVLVHFTDDRYGPFLWTFFDQPFHRSRMGIGS
jgi:hypothetical protein